MKEVDHSPAVFFLGNNSNYKKISKSKGAGGSLVACSNFKNLNLDNFFHCKRMQKNNSDQDLFESSIQDFENGNIECRSTHQGIEDECGGLLRRKKSDVSYGGETTLDMDFDENCNYGEKDHSFLRFLLDSIRFPRRKRSHDEFASQFINCSYTDSCRCLDCQSRYFECDDDEEDEDMDLSAELEEEFNNTYNEYTQKQEQLYQQQLAAHLARKTTPVDRSPSGNHSPEKAKPPASNAPPQDTAIYDMGDDVTMMAGTPVFLSYLLNHPISCNIM